MFPAIGPLQLYTVVYVIGILAHFFFAQRWCHKLALQRRVGVWLSGLYFIGMAFGARILYDLVEHQFDPANYFPFRNALKSLQIGYCCGYGLWGGPLAYFILGMPFSLLYSRRRNVLDLLVLSLSGPMVLAKFACLLQGCCYGLPCDWPWCIAFPPGADAPAGIARHPTQAYEIILLLAIWLVLIKLQRSGSWFGLLTLWFVALYGVGRLLTEFFRAFDGRQSSIGFLTTSQAVCLAAALLAVVGLWILRPRMSPVAG